MNSLLDPLSLPNFSALTPEAISAALDEGLADHREVVARLSSERPTSFAEAWLPFERTETRLSALWQAVSHLHMVADTPQLRDAHAVGEQRLVENFMEVGQNRALFEVFASVASAPEFAALAVQDRVVIERKIRDFTLTGVALDEQERERFRAISLELSALSTAFGSAVLDATEAWHEHVIDRALLAGIGEADIEMFANAAASRGLDGWLVTLQQRSVFAVQTYAEDRGLRARVYEAFNTRASDQGPHARQFDNSGRIAQILKLRREAASLLGYADPVALSLATKMARDADEVLGFLRGLAMRAKPAAQRELAQLRDYASAELGMDVLEPWDIAFASNRLREARYAIDERKVREFFPVEHVLEGWQRLLTALFGLTLTQRGDVPTYHPDAHYYDVSYSSGKLIAGLYVDLHARPGKRPGAWMDEARPRIADGNLVRNPVANMVCNFAPTGGETPSLLSHSDIVTLLHETGHALHLLLTRVDRPSIAGTRGFEWDAIELPSQLMEDFAWDRSVLAGMSHHFQTGASLPDEMFDQIVAARRFQTGMFLVRQLEFAMFDLLLHLGGAEADPLGILTAVRAEVAVLQPPDWHRFPHAFSHIFAGGYASGYYSYLWAEVLAADGFLRFAETGLLDRSAGEALREHVLARGATRPASDSFRAFRGREPDPEAILRRHGLIEAQT